MRGVTNCSVVNASDCGWITKFSVWFKCAGTCVDLRELRDVTVAAANDVQLAVDDRRDEPSTEIGS